MKKELWKDLPGHEGVYQVSNLGRIRSLILNTRGGVIELSTPRILKQFEDKGYCGISLCRNGKKHTKKMHRLVLETFVGPCPEGMECAHLDGNRANNALTNLAWTTRKVNHSHKHLHGTAQIGSRQGSAKLTEGQVAIIKSKFNTGISMGAIAREYGVCLDTILKIRHGKRWKHVHPIKEK